MRANEFYGRTGALAGHQVEVEYESSHDEGYQLCSVKLDGHEAIDELSRLDEGAIYEELDSFFLELDQDIRELGLI